MFCNALSGWCSISTGEKKIDSKSFRKYQCPFGLVLHFYPTALWGAEERCKKYQCPFGLVLHFYAGNPWYAQFNNRVSMPFRAGASFLRYPFKNLGFMRFLEPVFAGIYQNILTMTIFRAC